VTLNARQLEIARLIQRVKQLDVRDLAQRFQISPVTIRKDLDILQMRGILKRTHGGALLAEDVDRTVQIDRRMDEMVDAKESIARAALDLIFDCESVALDAGSTTLALAQLLKQNEMRVVTNSLLIAQGLSARESGSVILLGGTWRRESSCYLGPDTLQMLERMNIDIAFVGTSGISLEAGFSCQNSLEALVKAKILSRAQRKFILGDSSKYGRRAFSTFANLDEVDGLVTDEGLGAKALAELTGTGLHVVTARMGS